MNHKGAPIKKTAAEPHRDINFSTARRSAVITAEPSKTKISIRIDNAVMAHFCTQVEHAGAGNYQTLINNALLAFIQQRSVVDALRLVVREELAAPRSKVPSSPRWVRGGALAA